MHLPVVDVWVVSGLGSIMNTVAADSSVHVLCSDFLLGKYRQGELLTHRVGVQLGESVRPLFKVVAVLVTFQNV